VHGGASLELLNNLLRDDLGARTLGARLHVISRMRQLL